MSTGKTYSTKYLLDTNNNRGAEGQVLISTSEGVNWSDGSDITGGPYLPLSAGSSYPLTGGLSFSITTDTVSPVASIKYNSNNYVYFTGGTSGALFGNSNQSVRLQTNATSLQMLTGGSSRMFIDSAGNVGIGTTSPDEKLHVVGNVFLNANSAFKASYNNTDNYHGSMRWAGLQLGNNGANRIVAGRTDTGGGFQFWTNNTNDAANYTVTPDGIMTMAMTETGNVGIGTTSPGAKLDVEAGDTGAALGDSTTAAIFRTGRQNVWFQNQRTVAGTDWNNNTFKIIAKIDTTSHQSINFVNDASYNEHIDIYTGNQVFNTRFNANGNVGIGTTSPSTKLDVLGGAGNDIIARFKTTGTGTSDYSEIHILNDNDDRLVLGSIGSNYTNSSWAGMRYVYSTVGDLGLKATASDGNVRIYAGGAGNERMRITSSGNVGIGTTSPNQKLVVNTNATAGIANLSDIDKTSGNLVRFTNPQYSTDASMGILLRVFPDSDVRQGAGIIASGGGTNERTNLSLFVSKDGDGTSSLSYAALTAIGSTGNIGIGTTSPNAKLDVQGTQGQLFSVTDDLSGDIFSVADISGVPIMNVNSDGTSYFDGNVGIGTDSPDTKLHIRNTTNSQLTIERTGTAPGKYGFYTNTGNLFINNVTGGASTIPMIILNNGNVGIGAGNPSSKLAIDGGFDYPTVRWFSSNNTSRYMQVGMITPTEHSIRAYGSSSELTFWTASSFSMVIDSGGNVGIGTTSPTTPLSIESSGADDFIKITNTATYTGLWMNDSGTNNGWLVLSGYTDAVSSGDFAIREYGVQTSLTIKQTTGNVGIGTTSPDAKLQLGNYPSNNIDITTYPNVPSEHMIHITAPETTNRYGGGISFGENAFTAANITVQDAGGSGSLHMLFGTRNTSGTVAERMRITNAGNVGIGTTSPSEKLQVDGNVQINGLLNVDNDLDVGATATFNDQTFFYDDLNISGGIIDSDTTITATNFILSSDERLKENVKKVCDNRVKVDWKTFELKTEKGQKRYGVIAQELEKTNPEFVRENNQGFKSVAYIDLLIAKIAELEARLEKLEK